MDLEHEAGVRARSRRRSRAGWVRLVVPTSRSREPVDASSSGMPEAVADLDQLAAADHDLLARGEGHGGEQQRGGVVVDDVHTARGGYRAGQRGQRTATAAGAAAGLQVELDVGGAAGRDHRVDRGL